MNRSPSPPCFDMGIDFFLETSRSSNTGIDIITQTDSDDELLKITMMTEETEEIDRMIDEILIEEIEVDKEKQDMMVKIEDEKMQNNIEDAIVREFNKERDDSLQIERFLDEMELEEEWVEYIDNDDIDMANQRFPQLDEDDIEESDWDSTSTSSNAEPIKSKAERKKNVKQLRSIKNK